ncbi:MAG TPA: XRE family transcriptional regulator, partial [Candidatus Latescibacteria bacterium]|nr:XRE family transcriptional regulator [Candidatus Latescibacterota bacterium]
MSTVLAKKVQSGYTRASISPRADLGSAKRPPDGLTTVQDRLRALRGSTGYRPFALRVGVTPNSVRRYELGMARVPVDYLEAVCRAFNVSADWLIFGVEAAVAPMEPLARAIREENAPVKRSVLINGERVRIVCVPVLNRVPAGAPAEMLDDMPVGFGLEGFVRVPDPGDPNAYALTAWGDSMEPLIRDGERFVVSPRRAHGFSAGIAVVRIGAGSPGDPSQGDLCVKHVRLRGERVEVMPANSRYPGRVFCAGEVAVLGKVTMVVGNEAPALRQAAPWAAGSGTGEGVGVVVSIQRTPL